MSGLFAVIMAGGSGTRFWPASRERRPKQFQAIGTDAPLLAATSARLAPLIPPERQMVITAARHAEAVRELLPDVPPTQVIGEPAARDTAACVGLAGQVVARIDADATVVAMPADHVLSPVADYHAALLAAEAALAAHPDSLLVFGVEPDRPATGYGWLRRGDRVGEYGGREVYALDAFVEKPDARRAQELLDAGGHFFNAGLFAFRPEALETAYVSHLPDMVEPLRRMGRAFHGDEFDAVLKQGFGKLQKISIDYGVMERLHSALLLPLPLRWDDVGSWDALARLKAADADGNVVEGEAVVLESHRNIVSARDGVVAIKGVDDLIVVHTPDATLVCRRDDEQGVKQIVEALKAAGLEKYL